jgi:hypothetical protein
MTKESSIQTQCVAWFRKQYPKEIIFSIPNGALLGGKNRFAVYNSLKATGLMKGIPDLFIAKTKVNYIGSMINMLNMKVVDYVDAGLFIEMKQPKTYATEEQQIVHRQLMDKGYRVRVCKSLEQFMEEVKDYMG